MNTVDLEFIKGLLVLCVVFLIAIFFTLAMLFGKISGYIERKEKERDVYRP